MANFEIDEEVLVAFLKGELDAAQAAAVEAWYDRSAANRRMLGQVYYILSVSYTHLGSAPPGFVPLPASRFGSRRVGLAYPVLRFGRPSFPGLTFPGLPGCSRVSCRRFLSFFAEYPQQRQPGREGQPCHYAQRVGHPLDIGLGGRYRFVRRMESRPGRVNGCQDGDADASSQLFDAVRDTRRSGHVVLREVPQRKEVQRGEREPLSLIHI